MTLPRSILIDTEFTPFYHCMSRCVRRAFLCGKDRQTGYDFSHRKDWIEARVQALTNIFAIDVCAYAVMSNHYHLVLHINEVEQAGWSDGDVVDRWGKLYSLPDWFEFADETKIDVTVSRWRQRLGSISWLMKCINEPLARMANKEDGCKGRFWEGRFKSQALLDEASLLKCMAYVDLNPIRAKLADTPETSTHTSIQARIRRIDQKLAPMIDRRKQSDGNSFCLPIKHQEYIQFVDWTGCQVDPRKRGWIKKDVPPIVARVHKATNRNWVDEMKNLTRLYFRAIGTYASLMTFRDQLGQDRLKGLIA